MYCNVKRGFIQRIHAMTANALHTLVLCEDGCFKKMAKNRSTYKGRENASAVCPGKKEKKNV